MGKLRMEKSVRDMLVPDPGKIEVPFVRPRSLVDDLVQELRSRIASGVLKAGRIRINRLAEECGVSPVPVREALRQLQAEGLVVFGSNREVRVVKLTQAEVKEIYSMRMLLEPEMLRVAVDRGLRESQYWDAATAALEHMREAGLGSSNWLKENAVFHQSMYSAARMPTFMRTVQSLWAGVNSILVAYGQSRSAVELAQHEHEDLYACIEEGRSDKAAELLRQHLNGTLDECLRLMRARDEARAVKDQ